MNSMSIPCSLQRSRSPVSVSGTVCAVALLAGTMTLSSPALAQAPVPTHPGAEAPATGAPAPQPGPEAAAEAPAQPAPAPAEPPAAAPAGPGVAEPQPPAAVAAPATGQLADVAALRARVEQLEALSELQQLQTEPVDESSYDDRFRMYGFFDAGLQRTWQKPDAGYMVLGATRAWTFLLGNVNLYFDAKPAEDWRVLTEVRFTLYPNGAVTPGDMDPETFVLYRQSTDVTDVSGSDGATTQIEWGSIVLERSYAQWQTVDWFGLRAGLWFTPWGIWNVDHGTPTLISMRRPEFSTQRLHPLRQIGVQAYGSFDSEAWIFEYSSYVSNGRVERQFGSGGGQDWTNNKMLGGRLTAKLLDPIELTFGVSGFIGEEDDVERRTVSFNPHRVEETPTVAALNRGLGADVSADIGPLRIRTEGLVARTDFQHGRRPYVWGPEQGFLFADTTRWGGYGLVAYELPWFGLEPYVYVEALRDPTPVYETIRVYSGGLNIHFNAAAQLKTQYAYRKLDPDSSLGTIHWLSSRIVVAF